MSLSLKRTGMTLVWQTKQQQQTTTHIQCTRNKKQPRPHSWRNNISTTAQQVIHRGQAMRIRATSIDDAASGVVGSNAAIVVHARLLQLPRK
mmetsp:Transcript_6582/g.20563  ORF Transcript_6582/g.20563 Transcript_6582/m.20563 type:complete len:92 (+) Transcript_6582:118-393(+)